MNSFKLKIDAFCICKSEFYQTFSSISDTLTHEFSKGINTFNCEIDDKYFAISYLLSRYGRTKKGMIVYETPEVYIDGKSSTLEELGEKCCYIDSKYFEFSHRKSTRKLVEKGLSKSGIKMSADEIRDKFMITDFRFERNPGYTGNERFKAMAAVAYAFGKDVFCFPWFSRTRFDGFHRNLSDLMEILESLGKIVILPLGR